MKTALEARILFFFLDRNCPTKAKTKPQKLKISRPYSHRKRQPFTLQCFHSVAGSNGGCNFIARREKNRTGPRRASQVFLFTSTRGHRCHSLGSPPETPGASPRPRPLSPGSHLTLSRPGAYSAQRQAWVGRGRHALASVLLRGRPLDADFLTPSQSLCCSSEANKSKKIASGTGKQGQVPPPPRRPARMRSNRGAKGGAKLRFGSSTLTPRPFPSSRLWLAEQPTPARSSTSITLLLALSAPCS